MRGTEASQQRGKFKEQCIREHELFHFAQNLKQRNKTEGGRISSYEVYPDVSEGFEAREVRVKAVSSTRQTDTPEP